MLNRSFAPAILWGVFIFIISVIPGKDIPKVEDLWDLISVDKIVHMLVYGILAYLILRGYEKSNRKTTLNATFIIFLLTASYGWYLEIHQYLFCEDRLFDKMDGIANMLGALMMSFIHFRMFKLKNPK